MARGVAEDYLSRSPGGCCSVGRIKRESLTQATDPVLGQDGGGYDSEMPGSF